MKKHKRLLVFLFLAILIIILIIKISFINKEKKYEKTSKNEIKSVWKKKDISSFKINIYKDNISNDILASSNNDTYIEEKYTYLNSYNCSDINCKIYNYNISNNHIVIKDDKYIIYDYIKNLYKEIILPDDNYLDVKLIYFDSTDYGLALKNESNYYAFYSFKDKKIKTDYIYDDILTNCSSLLDNNFIGIKNENNLKIYDIINYKENIIINSTNNAILSIGNKNKIYYIEKIDDKRNIVYYIYNNEFKKFKDEYYYQIGVTPAGNLVVSSDNISFKIYNENGLFIKESKPYNKVYSILDKYVLVEDNDRYLKIIDFDSNVIKKVLYLDNMNYISSLYLNIYENELINITINDENNNLKVYSYSIKDKNINIY